MRAFILFILTISVCGSIAAQPDLARFESEIKAFELQDSTFGIKQNTILFTGSSSIRLWTTLEEDMNPLPILNRGFGGSTLPEVIHYADRIILPYKPDIIVLYCGENDLANDETTADEVYNNFRILYEYLRKHLPSTHLYYISMKPSVKRWDYWSKIDAGNKKIAKFIGKHRKYHYIDISGKMLDQDGVVYKDLFVEDQLHLNAKGYAIWTDIIKPKLMQHYPR